jgi:hypothetical protein
MTFTDKQHSGRHFGELVNFIGLQTGVSEGLALPPSPQFGAIPRVTALHRAT